MYPSQTSLIPVIVSLARYLEENGIIAVFGNYPYWYEGTTLFRYLTGPIVPFVLAGAHKFLADISLFTISLSLIIVSYLLSIVGWLILIKKLKNSKTQKLQEVKNEKIKNLKFLDFNLFGSLNFWIFGVLLLILPWRMFSSLAISETSFTIARNFLPWALLEFWRVLNRGEKGDKGNRQKLLALGLTTILLLINTSILPILIVGLFSLTLTSSFKNGKFKGFIKRLKKVLFLVTCSLLLVTYIWYTPGYWITVLFNPSIGGVSTVRVVFRIFDLLKSAVPLLVAVLTVYFSGKLKSRFSVFTLSWTFTFLFLTIFRFIGDPDFWVDWSTWAYELETGLVLLISDFVVTILSGLKTRKDQLAISNYQLDSNTRILSPRTFSIGQLALVILFIAPFFFAWRIYIALGRPTLISNRIPEGVKSLEVLNKIVLQDPKGKENIRVFLSGSTVFWANAFYDIKQVRGGKDEVVVDSTWDEAAYEFREGRNQNESKKWLERLDINYVLVHRQTSLEYYRDFSGISKWDKLGDKVWEENGDTIYKVLVDGIK